MEYKNQVIVFPMGLKANFSLHDKNATKLLIKNSKVKVQNRRKTLKIGNAIRLKNIKEDIVIDNCMVILEGTLTENGIEPYVFHK